MHNCLSLSGRWQPQIWMRHPPGHMLSSQLSSPKNDETRWLAWTLRRSVFKKLFFKQSITLVNEMECTGEQDQPGGPGGKWTGWLLGGQGNSAQGEKSIGGPETDFFVCILHFAPEANCLLTVWQEGANINKSLTTLGKVISALAEMVGSWVFFCFVFLINDTRKWLDLTSWLILPLKMLPPAACTAEQQEEEKWLHPLQRLCSHVAAKRKPGWETLWQWQIKSESLKDKVK